MEPAKRPKTLLDRQVAKFMPLSKDPAFQLVKHKTQEIHKVLIFRKVSTVSADLYFTVFLCSITIYQLDV